MTTETLVSDVVGWTIFATPDLPTWCNAVFMLDD